MENGFAFDNKITSIKSGPHNIFLRSCSGADIVEWFATASKICYREYDAIQTGHLIILARR